MPDNPIIDCLPGHAHYDLECRPLKTKWEPVESRSLKDIPIKKRRLLTKWKCRYCKRVIWYPTMGGTAFTKTYNTHQPLRDHTRQGNTY